MKGEVIDKLSALITAAFGLVAALAWNEAIQNWFKTQTWLAIFGPWAYAILVTVIAVLITIWAGKVAEKAKNTKIELKTPKIDMTTLVQMKKLTKRR